MKNSIHSNKRRRCKLLDYLCVRVIDEHGGYSWKVGLFYEDETPQYQLIGYMPYKKRESLDRLYDRCWKLRKNEWGPYRFGEYSPWYDEPWEAD